MRWPSRRLGLLHGATAQLLLLTVLPLTLVLAVISFGSIAMHQQAMRRLVGERDIRAVGATAGSIGALIQHKSDVLALIAERATTARGTPGAALDTLSLDDELARDFPGGVAVYDRGGALLANRETPPLWGGAAWTAVAARCWRTAKRPPLGRGPSPRTRC